MMSIFLTTKLLNSVYQIIKEESIFPEVLTKIILQFLKESECLGEYEWNTLIGRVDPEPPLPENFSLIWESPCPIFQGKKVYETHWLIYIPYKVDEKPLTLINFGEMTKRHFPENNLLGCYYSIAQGCLKAAGNKSIARPCWILMTKRGYRIAYTNFSQWNKNGEKYRLIGPLEAVISNVMNYLISNNKSHSNNSQSGILCFNIAKEPISESENTNICKYQNMFISDCHEDGLFIAERPFLKSKMSVMREVSKSA